MSAQQSFNDSKFFTYSYPDEVGCVVPELCEKICENPRSCSDIAYPKIVMELLPTGKKESTIMIYSTTASPNNF